MTNTGRKAPKSTFRRIFVIAAAMIVASTATVFAADYVINQRKIYFFDSTEELSEQYTADNPGYAVGVAVPNSAEEEVTQVVKKPVATNTTSPTSKIQDDIKSVLVYMDQLLENLPEEKIEEFAKSEHFDTYKKLFSELGISN